MFYVRCSTWFLLDSGPGDPAFNMALDEALLEAMPRLGRPVLRFYSWTEPAASFGYFQKHADVEQASSLRPLVRRPTAGGIVPHDADWTYSVVFPATHQWYALKAVESYRRIHEWLQRALVRLNVPTELAPVSRRVQPGQCFAGYEQYDLLWRGKKIAGAAQRRTRDGLLIQGSLQPVPNRELTVRDSLEPPPASAQNAISRNSPKLALQSPTLRFETNCGPAPARAAWQQAMCAVARDQGAEWIAFELDPLLRDRAANLEEGKYSQASYTRKR